jgi:hypothetical protein
MTIHLLKLCVGVENVQELKDWQTEMLKRRERARQPVEHRHRTRQMPKRRDAILDGGSLYWVIKGFILVRQRILDLRADVKDDGTACCGIVLDLDLVTTRAQARRPFQGWRYLTPADAPRDRGRFKEEDDISGAMRADLRELRLIDF